MQFLILFLPMMIIGLISIRGIKNADDTLVGGRGMGPWLSSFSYGTVYFSGMIGAEYAGLFGLFFNKR